MTQQRQIDFFKKGIKLTMKAMILPNVIDLTKKSSPLELKEIPQPIPKEKEILIKVSTCGVCHTELDEIEGRTPPPHFPMILGHQAVGRVEQTGNHERYGDK